MNVFRDFANLAISADVNESRDEVNDLSYFRKFNLEPQESYYDDLMLNEKNYHLKILINYFFQGGSAVKCGFAILIIF